MNVKKILAVIICLALCLATVFAMPVSADVVTASNTLIFDADHWDSTSNDYSATDTAVVHGFSHYIDAHYAAFTDTAAVQHVESEDGNYFTFTTRAGWDPSMTIRYNAYGNDINAYTANAEYVYMTVKFDEENLELFKNAKMFSKNVIGDASSSYDGNTALMLAVGPDSGVTFVTWNSALQDVNPDEWTTLKLAVTNGEGAVPNESQKMFNFYFGAQLSATMSIKNVRVGKRTGFFGTEGANIAAAPTASLRFVSTIDTYDLIPEGGVLVSYGTLLTHYDAVRYGEGDFERNCTIVYNDEDYVVADIVPAADDVVIKNSAICINTVISNIPEELYGTDFALKPYIVYSLGSREITEYADVVVKNVYDTAYEAVSSGNESEEITAQLNGLLNGYVPVSSKELALTNGSDYTMTSSAWYPQLSVATAATAVDKYQHYLAFDFACDNAQGVIDSFTNASRMSMGAADSVVYDYGSAYAIYFSGTNINYVGVGKNVFKAFLQNNLTALNDGKTVRAILPITNSFKNDSVITGIKFMIGHDAAAAGLEGIAVSLSDVKLYENYPYEATLTNGNDYSFTASAWYPQLGVDTAPTYITNAHKYLSFDFTCADIDTLIANTTLSSRSCGDTGDWSDGNGHPFKIYFDGTNVARIGVEYSEFLRVLNANRDALANGETVNLKFCIYNNYIGNNTSFINSIKFMPAHSDKAAAIEGLSFTLDNVKFETEECEEVIAVELPNGSDYALTASAWYPQLSVATSATVVPESVYEYVYMDVSCSDIETFTSLISYSSRMSSTSGEYTDGSGESLKIYFGGTNVAKIGVLYADFVSTITANKEAMANGATVTLKFKLTNSNLFNPASSITSIEFMPTHGDANAAAIAGIEWDVSNVYFDVK